MQVVACLRGEEELPWEGEHLKKVERKLGKMREPVLALLHRLMGSPGSGTCKDSEASCCGDLLRRAALLHATVGAGVW